MANEQVSSSNDNPLLQAIARWEWEGGALEPDWEKRVALVHAEEHILSRGGGHRPLGRFAYGDSTRTFSRVRFQSKIRSLKLN